ncbi:uncharacterized protein ARMOST_12822 [Armillaria ostoyae]|uniref:Uncharacterized protein n=1 Tax=Armillaria ostoyae TaxID=47428 RepID=A0A284RL20_ARMOS|nr:uncharacterized protein ARMOST_12822 [Armillaria ostoyae]
MSTTQQVISPLSYTSSQELEANLKNEETSVCNLYLIASDGYSLSIQPLMPFNEPPPASSSLATVLADTATVDAESISPMTQSDASYHTFDNNYIIVPTFDISFTFSTFRCSFHTHGICFVPSVELSAKLVMLFYGYFGFVALIPVAYLPSESLYRNLGCYLEDLSVLYGDTSSIV